MASSERASSSTARVALALAAGGVAAYAYYRLSRALAVARARDEDPSIAADVMGAARASTARDRETFASQSEEETAEMRRQAAVHMARLQAAGNMGQDGAGGMKNLTAEECGGVTDRYRWKQTEREIVLEFPIPRGVTSKHVDVRIETKTLKVAIRPCPAAEIATERVVIAGRLLRDVVPDECVWEIEAADDGDGGRKVVVTLFKLLATMAMHHWNCVVKGEPTIDVKKFGPAIVGINGNDPSALQRMMEGLPPPGM